MKSAWKSDVEMLKEEIKKKEERWQKADEELGGKYKRLLEEVAKGSKQRESFEELKKKDRELRESIEASFREEIGRLREEVERETKEQQKANRTAECVFAMFVSLFHDSHRRKQTSFGRARTDT